MTPLTAHVSLQMGERAGDATATNVDARVHVQWTTLQ